MTMHSSMEDKMADSKRHARMLGGALVAVLFAAGLAMIGAGAAQELQTLRGKVGFEDINPPPEVLNQQVPSDGRFRRAYPQQPPLIPHRIEGFQVTKNFNQCMTCHDRPANIKGGAPKISETHHNDWAGNRIDKISGTRYFCTQCHVPQNDAKPLVNNTFKNAAEVK